MKGMEGYLGSDGFKELTFYVIGRRKRKPIEVILELKGQEKRKC